MEPTTTTRSKFRYGREEKLFDSLSTKNRYGRRKNIFESFKESEAINNQERYRNRKTNQERDKTHMDE